MSFTDRVLSSIVKSRDLDRPAMRALMKATELLGLASGLELVRLRESPEPLQQAYGQAKLEAFRARGYAELAEILGERWEKIPERRRPHYTPRQRFQLLELKKHFGWSREELATRCRVSVGTIARWEQEVNRTGSETVGSLVKPNPPVRRLSDAVRRLVHRMSSSGFGGNARVAQVLARAGHRLSKRSVGRILKEKPPRAPVDERTTKPRRVTGKYPNHTVLVDITEIKSFLRLVTFRLVVVLDVFSRMPLAWRVFAFEPTAVHVAAGVEEVAEGPGVKHLITDQGTQFTAKWFQDEMIRLGILTRFGAIGKSGSIALLERLWRSLKGELALREFTPLMQRDLEERIRLGLHHQRTTGPIKDSEARRPRKSTTARDPLIFPRAHHREACQAKDPRSFLSRSSTSTRTTGARSSSTKPRKRPSSTERRMHRRRPPSVRLVVHPTRHSPHSDHLRYPSPPSRTLRENDKDKKCDPTPIAPIHERTVPSSSARDRDSRASCPRVLPSRLLGCPSRGFLPSPWSVRASPRRRRHPTFS